MTPPRTTGVDGLPLHRYGDLPDGLGTAGMLRERRLRLADGQPHVAWYLRIGSHGRGDYPLYRIADAEPLPPLKGRAAEKYTAARTCARCGVTGIHRLIHRTGGTHGRRLLDDACHRAELTAVNRTGWLRDRIAATAWAAGVLVDERVLLVDVRRAAGTRPARLYAATLAGRVVLDEELTGGRTWYEVAGTHHLDVLRPVVWGRWWWAIQIADGDDFEDRLSEWMMRPASSGGLTLCRRPDGADPRDVIQTMREQLALMARDEHPDGPPGGCPALPETGLVPCGEPLTDSGVCVEHRRPLLLAALAGGGHA